MHFNASHCTASSSKTSHTFVALNNIEWKEGTMEGTFEVKEEESRRGEVEQKQKPHIYLMLQPQNDGRHCDLSSSCSALL